MKEKKKYQIEYSSLSLKVALSEARCAASNVAIKSFIDEKLLENKNSIIAKMEEGNKTIIATVGDAKASITKDVNKNTDAGFANNQSKMEEGNKTIIATVGDAKVSITAEFKQQLEGAKDSITTDVKKFFDGVSRPQPESSSESSAAVQVDLPPPPPRVVKWLFISMTDGAAGRGFILVDDVREECRFSKDLENLCKLHRVQHTCSFQKNRNLAMKAFNLRKFETYFRQSALQHFQLDFPHLKF